MKLIPVLAWRNIWRNRRRTLITVSSIFFAVLLALVMRSMQLGSYDKMVRDIVGQYTGWIQIHAAGYWDEQTINHTMAVKPSILDTIHAIPGVHAILRRLESFALASGDSRTRGVQVIGIDPQAETAFTGPRVRFSLSDNADIRTAVQLFKGKMYTESGGMTTVAYASFTWNF